MVLSSPVVHFSLNGAAVETPGKGTLLGYMREVAGITSAKLASGAALVARNLGASRSMALVVAALSVASPEIREAARSATGMDLAAPALLVASVGLLPGHALLAAIALGLAASVKVVAVRAEKTSWLSTNTLRPGCAVKDSGKGWLWPTRTHW